MNIVNTINDKRFTLNGIVYLKNYISTVSGNRLTVFNCYEKKDVLIPLTHFSEFSVNGTVYSTVAQLQSAILEVIYSRSNMGDDSVFEQNNIGRTINLGFYFNGSGSTVANIVTRMNNRTTIITAIDTPVILSIYSLPSIVGTEPAPSITYSYLFKPGKGTYGIGGTLVTAANIFQLAPFKLTPADLADDPNAHIENLDPVVDGDFITKANLSEWDFGDSGSVGDNGGTITYYFSFTEDGVLKFTLFIGVPGVYGGGSPPFTEDDFIVTTDNTVVSEKTKLSEFENDVPFSTVAQVNGLTLSVNQAAAEMYLKNDAGDTLATINLGFLNNEGTTFYYNSVTGNLELKNDAGEILSTIPVSAFVTNLMQSVNFNAGTPSILEFKDAAGNVVDSVTFTIDNIAGLQAAMNALIAQTITDGVTTSAPSQDAVFDALALKADKLITLTYKGDIPGSADLNNYTDTGIYNQSLNADAATGSNYPVALAGKLEVVSRLAMVYQAYHVYSANNDLYIRTKNGSTWYPWIKVLDANDISATNIANWNTAYGWGDFRLFGLGVTTGKQFPSTNINDINTPSGIYSVEYNYTGVPISSSGSLIVERKGSYVLQKYQAINTGDMVRMFIRHYKPDTSAWTPWREIWTSENFTTSDIARWNASFPLTYLSPAVSATPTTGSSVNSLPFGTYSAFLSTTMTDKPHSDVGAFLSIGSGNIGAQLSIGRNENGNFYFRAYNGGVYGAWYKVALDAEVVHKTGNETLAGVKTFSSSPIVPDATTSGQVVNKGQMDAIVRPYKVYTAILAQSGTSAPVATVLENTIEAGVTWVRGAIGQYTLTFSSGSLTANKTIVSPVQVIPPYTNHADTSLSGNVVRIITTSTSAPADALLSSSYSFIEIRVYN